MNLTRLKQTKTGWRCVCSDCGVKQTWPETGLTAGARCPCKDDHWLLTDNRTARKRLAGQRILSIDPGTKNFAVCLQDGGIVRGTMYLHQLIDAIKTDEPERIDGYAQAVSRLLDTTAPDAVIIERFMARQFSAKIIELVGVMIGIMVMLCRARDVPLTIVSSAQWKTPFKRVGDLKALYAHGKARYGMEPHVIDAMLLGRYLANGRGFTATDKPWVKASLPLCIQNFGR